MKTNPDIYIIMTQEETWGHGTDSEDDSISLLEDIPIGYVFTEEDAKEYVALDYNRSYKLISFLDLGKGII